ncbi:MAG: trypsin-like serine protease [Gammaproteobacteria bacterium]|nr:trypsin-like serine protease [Gammaproteobacteria bacterium]
MKSLARCLFLYIMLNSSAHAIVMGNLADIDEYSEIGSVVTFSSIGSFVAVSEFWVLTAAHVVDTTPPLVLIGGHPDGAAGEDFFFIGQVIIHPNYVTGELHDDLALIQTTGIDPLTANVSFATFSSLALPGNLPAATTVTGYGQTTIGVDQTSFDRRFMSVATETTDPFDRVGVPPFPTIFPTDCAGGVILCAYGTGGGAPGDSGGGMFLHTVDGEAVAAINSFIFDETDFDPANNDMDPNNDIPPNWADGYWTVGTSVAAYEDWIKDPMGDGSILTHAQFSSAAFVPIPPVIWLFGSGIFGIIAVSRRKNAA